MMVRWIRSWAVCVGIAMGGVGVLGSVGVASAATVFQLPPIGDGAKPEHHPGKMIWADLLTPNLAAAKRFYGGLFGWKFSTVRAGTLDYVVASVDGRAVAGLLGGKVPAGEQRQPAWLTFLSVKDVDTARSLALSHGARSLSEPKSYPGRGRQAVLADPEGAVFAVLASDSGDPPEELASPGEWIWSSVLERDPAQGAAFYQAVFDYDVFELPSDDAGEHMIFSGASEDYARAGVNPLSRSSAKRHAHWLDFIRVVDVAATVKQAVALGGRVLVEAHTDRHGDPAAVLADPSGAPIGIMQWSAWSAP